MTGAIKLCLSPCFSLIAMLIGKVYWRKSLNGVVRKFVDVGRKERLPDSALSPILSDMFLSVIVLLFVISHFFL